MSGGALKNLSRKGYLLSAGAMSLSSLDEDEVVSAAFLKSYCGWSAEDFRDLRVSDKKAFRFGDRGRLQVSGYRLGDALKMERTKAFRTRHAAPLSVSESELSKSYFFTDKIIRDFGVRPDSLVANPRFRSAAPMKLHRVGKILLLRSSPDVRSRLDEIADQRDRRSESSKAAAERRTQAWISKFNETKVSYDFCDIKIIEKEVREIHGYTTRTWEGIDLHVRQRWTVNHIRHERTSYDQMLMLDLPPGVAGRRCYASLKTEILSKIFETYPDLASEADNQIQRINEEKF